MKRKYFIIGLCLLLLSCSSGKLPDEQISEYFGRRITVLNNNDFVGSLVFYRYEKVWVPYGFYKRTEKSDSLINKKLRDINVKIEKECREELDKQCNEEVNKITEESKRKGLLGWHRFEAVTINGIKGNLKGALNSYGEFFLGTGSSIAHGRIEGNLNNNVEIAFFWEYEGQNQICRIDSEKVYFIIDKKTEYPAIRLRYHLYEVSELLESNSSPCDFIKAADSATIKISQNQARKFLLAK
jgi:hypothetical protein